MLRLSTHHSISFNVIAMSFNSTHESRLIVARALLLERHGVDERDLVRTLDSIYRPGVDDADLYFQFQRNERWGLDDGLIKGGSFGISEGFGMRTVQGGSTAFAHSDEIGLLTLAEAARAVRTVGATGPIGLAGHRPPGDAFNARLALYSESDPLLSLGPEAKVLLLQAVERRARLRDPRVRKVSVELVGQHDVVLIARADGALVADVRPLVKLSVSVIVEQHGRRESGYASFGGRLDYGQLEAGRFEPHVDKAVDEALVNLEARPAPAGPMTVVLGPGSPGMLLHEAVGHGLEGDHIRTGQSAFSGRLGERVAASGVTVVDDGTMLERRGSLHVDDEGHPTQRTLLVEDGILRGYLQDRQSARLLKMGRTGNARRQSYAHPPMPRMTNTFMLNGDKDPQEIIASVERGLYAVNFSGGQVDITSGKFVFSACQAYLIENGRIGAPVKGATMIGDGPQSLQNISMIGNDLELDSGMAVCGKAGQNVPVGVGQPTLRIDNMTVGGTA